MGFVSKNQHCPQEAQKSTTNSQMSRMNEWHLKMQTWPGSSQSAEDSSPRRGPRKMWKKGLGLILFFDFLSLLVSGKLPHRQQSPATDPEWPGLPREWSPLLIPNHQGEQWLCLPSDPGRMAGDHCRPEQESPGMVSASDRGESCVGPLVVTMGTESVQTKAPPVLLLLEKTMYRTLPLCQALA